MEAKQIDNKIYSIHDFYNILFQGFDFQLPQETIEKISTISKQVGSPDYVKTPVFQKKDNYVKNEIVKENGHIKKNRRGKSTSEVINDEDWNAIRSFQTTKIEEKTGFDVYIDLIRVNLNKVTDKNYIDIVDKIVKIMDELVSENSNENMNRISSIIFEIASTNRYFSKVYADLYSELSGKFDIIKTLSEKKLEDFTSLFNTIEYVDPNLDYDKFCEINKTNEKRKALAAFYLNLMLNGIISKTKIKQITRNLLSQINTFISEENKKNEVDELTETISILYNVELYKHDECDDYELIDDLTISDIIHKIANSKVKDYKSLTNKSLFKFMDLIDM
jgi:hypothetical protein